MTSVKPWYASRTVWGSLIAVAAALLSAVGINMDEPLQKAAVDVILQIVAVSGSLFAVHGRFKATSLIE